ncbi:type IV pilus modification protein PilV [Delftia lacustris]|uniref:type IV pilus modification protein PilV n=1 Tax=Delftia lacustris TaxID=558537 RepID=UPI0035A6D389
MPQLVFHMKLSPSPRHRGITLIETLIALVVAALGILGVLGMQMRTLADSQTGVRRAQAIRLIEDLSEHTRVNPNSLGQIDNYLSGWNSTPTRTTDCATSACAPSALAAFQMNRWKTSVSQRLPGGDANVFIAEDEVANAGTGNQRQLGVMISWRENERSGDATYRDPIGLDSDGARGSGAVACPAGKTCHLQYIPLSARCAPYFADATVKFFCTGQ